MPAQLLQSPLLLLAVILVLSALGIVLLSWLRNRQADSRADLANQVTRLGFQPAAFDPQLLQTLKSLSLGTNWSPPQGNLYHSRRGETNYYLLTGSLMSASNIAGYQFSMLVTSSTLGLPRMAMMPQLQMSGLFGRFADEVLEHIPMGSLQPVELEDARSFRLFAESPMQARAYFDGWRLAQLNELSRVFVSCNGNAFLCSLLETNPQKYKNLTASNGINRLFDVAQGLHAGFTQ
jgi:hypothetical protein